MIKVRSNQFSFKNQYKFWSCVTIISILLLSTFSFGQISRKSGISENVKSIRCGTPTLSQTEKEAIHQQTLRFLAEHHQVDAARRITIPVAFHVITTSSGAYNVSNSQINQQIDVLNQGYSNTNFRFTLHSIDRTRNNSWAEGNDEQGMKRTRAVDPAHILNFYTVNMGLLGYAYYPNAYPENSYLHGVVCV